VLKIITYGSLFLSLMLLSSCWTIPIQTDTPDEFTQSRNSLVSLSGSTSEEVVNSIGLPAWIVQKDKDEKTYYIYQWWSNDTDWMWVGYLPSPIVFSEKASESHCILLEFGNDKRLRSYKVDSDSGNLYDGGITDNCLEVFGMQGSATRVSSPEEKERWEDELQWILNMEVATYCPNADLGHADAQKHIGDLYYHGSYGLEKDYVMAFVWYSLATNNGDSYTFMQLEKLIIELSPEQLVEAQHQLEQWEPGQCERDLMGAISEKDE